MRISDWSSDVCSSDLVRRRGPGRITCRCIDPLRARGGDRAPGAGGLTDRRQRPGALLARFRRHRAWNPGLASPDAAIQPWTVAGEAGGRSFRPQAALTAPRRLVSSTAAKPFTHPQGQWPHPTDTETECRTKPPTHNLTKG